MHESTDQIKQVATSIESKRASVVTIQDLIRHALAHGMKLSELTSSGAQLR